MVGFVRGFILCGVAVAMGAGNVSAESSDPPESAPAERVAHPEPRVVVNVLALRGPHDPAKVQHAARFGWKRIVRCYKATGAKRPANVYLGVEVSGEGAVSNAWSAHTNPEHRELSACLADALRGLPMPKAAAASTADLEIRLAPGDRPSKRGAC